MTQIPPPPPLVQPQVSRKKVIIVSAVAGGVVILGALAGVLAWLLLPGSVDRAMKYAPPDAIGVVHVNYGAVIKEVLDELRKNKDMLDDLPAGALEEIEKTVGKISCADIFLLQGEWQGPQFVAAVRTSLSPDDIMRLVEKLGAPSVTLKKSDNGRYDTEDGEVRMIFGAEAQDVEDGVILFGARSLLTEQFVAKLGTEGNETLRKMLKEIDTSAPMWVALSIDSAREKDAPKKAVGFLDPRGEGRGHLTITLKEEKHAREFIEGATTPDSPVADLLAFDRQGKTVTITLKGEGPFMDRVFVALRKTEDLARRARCAANLAAVGKNIAIYVADQQTYPASLQVILENGYLGQSLMKCPSAGGQRSCDYFYLAPERSATTQTIIACDMKGNHEGEGRNVLFAYRRVAWMTEQEFQEALRNPVNARFAEALKGAEGP